jgi:Leucine Rich repeat
LFSREIIGDRLVPSSPGANPGRKYFRFSMRGLIVVVLLMGGWIGWVARSARIQHDAVLAIEKAGGMTGYDWQWRNDRWVSGAKPWAPDWLVKAFGADYFGVVVVVFVSMQKAPDDLFTHIENLGHLEVVFISDSALTDDNLDHLKNLLSLRNLQLTRSGPRGGVKISDAGIDRLKGLVNIEHLGLAGIQITDAALASLKRMTKMADLGMEDTPITDAGLVHVEGLTNLSYLDLSGTQITDGGLKHLRPLTKLGLCYVRNTHITDEGVRELQKALPSLKMYR